MEKDEQKLIEQKLRKFVRERNWQEFHTPKNLAIALSIEAAELLELFLWVKEEKLQEKMQNEVFKERIEEEIADVYHYLLHLSMKLDIDLTKASLKKIEKNKQKYTIEKSKKFSQEFQ